MQHFFFCFETVSFQSFYQWLFYSRSFASLLASPPNCIADDPFTAKSSLQKIYGKEDAFVYTLRLPVLSPTPPSRHSTIRSSHPIFAITWHNHRFFTAILTHQMSSTDQNVIRNYHIRTPSCALFWKHNSLEYLPVTHPLQLTHPTATPPSPLHRPLVYLLTGNGTLFDYKCHCREMTESDQFLRFNLFFKL